MYRSHWDFQELLSWLERIPDKYGVKMSLGLERGYKMQGSARVIVPVTVGAVVVMMSLFVSL